MKKVNLGAGFSRLIRVIKDSKASILVSTNAFLPQKNDFNAGLIFQISPVVSLISQFHSKPPSLIYLKLQQYKSYTVNIKVCGMNLKLWQLFLLLQCFFVIVSVIIASTFSHNVFG